MGRKKHTNRGYCFVNLSSHQRALEAWGVMLGHTWKRHRHRQRSSFHPGADSYLQQQRQKQPWRMHMATPGADAVITTASVSLAEIQGYEENLRSRELSFQRIPAVGQNVWSANPKLLVQSALAPNGMQS